MTQELDKIYFVTQLAYERGLKGLTYATPGETITPGYDEAYTLGAQVRDRKVIPEAHFAFGCHCLPCRLNRIRDAARRKEREQQCQG